MWYIQLVSKLNDKKLSPKESYETEWDLFNSVRKTNPVIRFQHPTDRGALYRAFHPLVPGNVFFEVWEEN